MFSSLCFPPSGSRTSAHRMNIKPNKVNLGIDEKQASQHAV